MGAGQRSPGQGPSGRSPSVGTYEGWVTSYGVCGHLLDSLSAWGHSATLLKPEQARFGRFYGIMFFRKASPQTEGRRDAHPLIKTSPVIRIFILRCIVVLILDFIHIMYPFKIFLSLLCLVR